jgi:hypothetical protein
VIEVKEITVALPPRFNFGAPARQLAEMPWEDWEAWKASYDTLADRCATLETALIRWYHDHVCGQDCTCQEVHFLNLCPSCSADESLRDIAGELAAAALASSGDTTAPKP